jgi:uracil-DNA glycosylase
MGIVEDISEDWHAALAALAWQVDLGISESVGDAAVNRYELTEAVRPAARLQSSAAAPSGAGPLGGSNAVMAAEAAAAGAGDLAALRAAIDAFPHCGLRQGARNLVFAEGVPGAKVLVLCPAPGREEDQEGRVFAGVASALFDKMFAAIGLARDSRAQSAGIYLCPVLPWRTPSDRAPDADEIAMMRPFVRRHIALAQPEVVVAMGNVAAALLLGKAEETGIGIGRLRGSWHEAMGLAVLPMFDPAHLMRNPAAKREAWADLLALQSRLRGQK